MTGMNGAGENQTLVKKTQLNWITSISECNNNRLKRAITIGYLGCIHQLEYMP